MAVICRFTGLYLVLIVTLLLSMGIFGLQMLEVALEAPGQARALGKAVGIASQRLSLCPRLTWEASLALDGILSQRNSCGTMEGTVRVFKLWVLPFPGDIYQADLQKLLVMEVG